LLEKPWQKVREGVEVKLHSEDGEMYVYARSHHRVAKERAMRLRQLRGLLRRLRELSEMTLPARELLLKLGEARERYRNAWRLLDLELPEPVRGKKTKAPARFAYRLNRDKLRKARRREGRYLLRANMPETTPAELWDFYIQLTEIEAAFKTLKDDLDLRPIYHQLDSRIEAHIFISFLAYCLHVTLRARLRPHAPGLTSRAVLDKFAAIQMLDVHLPTMDGRTLILSRYTQPENDQKILLEKLNLQLPDQPPPRITSTNQLLH
jgi:transposase